MKVTKRELVNLIGECHDIAFDIWQKEYSLSNQNDKTPTITALTTTLVNLRVSGKLIISDSELNDQLKG